jgi:hypothetical protein
MEEGNMTIEIGRMKRDDLEVLHHGTIGHGRMSASLLIRMKRLGLGAGIDMMIGHIIDMRRRGESTRRESLVGMMIIRVNGRGVGIPTDERNHQKQRGNMKRETVGDMRKERLRIRFIAGMKIGGDMGMGEKRRSVNMGNIAKGHVRVVVDIETHHPRTRKMIITSVGAGRDQEQEVVVVIETIEGNELGHTLLERNQLQRMMRRRGKLQRRKSNLSEWTTDHRVRPLYRRMDLISP